MDALTPSSGLSKQSHNTSTLKNNNTKFKLDLCIVVKNIEIKISKHLTNGKSMETTN